MPTSSEDFRKLPEEYDPEHLVDREALKKLLEPLLEAKPATDTYFRHHFYALGTLDSGLSDKEKIRRVFRFTVADRGGRPSRPYEDIIRDFDTVLERDWCIIAEHIRNGKVAQAHANIVNALEGIEEVGQKITNLWLKYVVYYHDIWSEMKHFLFMPIDVKVTTSFFKKTGALNQIASETYLYKPRSSDKSFNQFQGILKTVAEERGEPRVVFDNHWFVNHYYCSGHLCGICPVSGKGLCREEKELPPYVPINRR